MDPTGRNDLEQRLLQTVSLGAEVEPTGGNASRIVLRVDELARPSIPVFIPLAVGVSEERGFGDWGDAQLLKDDVTFALDADTL
jgi:hypothetical protein